MHTTSIKFIIGLSFMPIFGSDVPHKFQIRDAREITHQILSKSKESNISVDKHADNYQNCVDTLLYHKKRCAISPYHVLNMPHPQEVDWRVLHGALRSNFILDRRNELHWNVNQVTLWSEGIGQSYKQRAHKIIDKAADAVLNSYKQAYENKEIQHKLDTLYAPAHESQQQEHDPFLDHCQFYMQDMLEATHNGEDSDPFIACEVLMDTQVYENA